MRSGWSVAEAAACVGGSVEGPNLEMPLTFRVDSREVLPGEGFVALKGNRLDGHDFLQDAVARDAWVLLLSEERRHALPPEENLREVARLLVQDSSKALKQLALARKQRTGLRETIAVTGSVGKTSTREMISFLLGSFRRVHAAGKSYNTDVGCALTLLAMPSDTETLVLEMGASHPGEIRELTADYLPEIAVITEVVPAHLEGFGSLEGVLRAKWEITESSRLEMLSYNADNEMLCAAAATLPSRILRLPVGYAVTSRQGVRIEEAKLIWGEQGPLLSARYVAFGEKVQIQAPLFGLQHARTLGYALALGSMLGMRPRDAAERLGSASPVSGRGVLRRWRRGYIVDESYNANPASMRSAIESVASLPLGEGETRIAVLGGMRELGAESPRLHDEVAAFALQRFDRVIFIGDEWRENADESGAMTRVENVEEAAETVLRQSSDGGLLLVKGSRAYGLERVLALVERQ